MIRLGDHVIVKGEDEEAIVTAVHPDSQVEIEFLHASEGRTAAQALRRRSARESFADLLIRLLHALLGWNVRQWPFSADLLDGIALCDRPVMDACWDCNERPRR